jgi:hypothetical protein
MEGSEGKYCSRYVAETQGSKVLEAETLLGGGDKDV